MPPPLGEYLGEYLEFCTDWRKDGSWNTALMSEDGDAAAGAAEGAAAAAAGAGAAADALSSCDIDIASASCIACNDINRVSKLLDGSTHSSDEGDTYLVLVGVGVAHYEIDS